MRNFVLAVLAQLLIALIGIPDTAAPRERCATIDAALETAAIAGLPDRIIEASKKNDADGACTTVPGGVVVFDAAHARTALDVVVGRAASRVASIPRARSPPASDRI